MSFHIDFNSWVLVLSYYRLMFHTEWTPKQKCVECYYRGSRFRTKVTINIVVIVWEVPDLKCFLKWTMMTLFVKKLRCSEEYPVLGVILTGGAWDRDGGMGSSSSGSGWFQCLALYTALVGDCGKKQTNTLTLREFSY